MPAGCVHISTKKNPPLVDDLPTDLMEKNAPEQKEDRAMGKAVSLKDIMRHYPTRENTQKTTTNANYNRRHNILQASTCNTQLALSLGSPKATIARATST